MGILTVNHVSKAYKRYPSKWARAREWITGKTTHDKTWVLRDINFTVNPGEAVGIVGVNGAGKSTLLKIITGTTQPTSGCVKTQGRVAALLELGMGFHPDFTGRQNIFMAGQILGYSRDELCRLMTGIEEFADIGEYIDRPLRVYSSGMQARLAFSVATATCPSILIVDEALSVGDPRFQAKCFERISSYKSEGMTLLLVSHSPMDLVKHCSRAIYIKNGQIEMDGSSRDVINKYMDHLFGAQNKSTTLDFDGGRTGLDVLNITTSQAYETRPGYRKEEYRWGEGGAKIVDYVTRANGQNYPSVVHSKSEFEIFFKVFFDQDYEDVTPGLLIKTVEGLFVYGTNSYISSGGRIRVGAKKGHWMLFKFSLKMILNHGSYLISLGVSSGDPALQTVPLDRRYDSIVLEVVNPVHMWGMVDMAADFCIVED